MQTGVIEYVMLGIAVAALLAVLAVWRGRMRRPLTWREDWIIPIVLGVVQLPNIVFLCIGAQWAILRPRRSNKQAAARRLSP